MDQLLILKESEIIECCQFQGKVDKAIEDFYYSTEDKKRIEIFLVGFALSLSNSLNYFKINDTQFYLEMLKNCFEIVHSKVRQDPDYFTHYKA